MVCDQGPVLGVHDRVAIGSLHWTVDRVLHGAPISPREGRMAVHARNRRVLGIKKSRGARGVGAAARAAGQHRPIEIEHVELPFAIPGKIGIHVLADVVPVGIKIDNDVLRGEDAHPFLDIDHAHDRVGIGLGRRAVDRVDEGKDVGVIISETRRAEHEIPAVFLSLLHSAGRCKYLQLRLRISR